MKGPTKRACYWFDSARFSSRLYRALAIRWRRRWLLASLSLLAGTDFSTELRQCQRPAKRRQCPCRPPSSTLSSAVESSTRRRWSEHNAPAAGFSTSIAQSSGRTGPRSCPLSTTKRSVLFPPPESNSIRFSSLENSKQRISIHRQSGIEHSDFEPTTRASAFSRSFSRCNSVYRCDKYTRE